MSTSQKCTKSTWRSLKIPITKEDIGKFIKYLSTHFRNPFSTTSFKRIVTLINLEQKQVEWVQNKVTNTTLNFKKRTFNQKKIVPKPLSILGNHQVRSWSPKKILSPGGNNRLRNITSFEEVKSAIKDLKVL